MDSIKDSLPNELEKLEEEAALDVQEDEDDDEEEEGETRCICGELEAPDGSGLYIQCEQCAVWQHGSCVGIADGEDSHVEKYWCEKCKPELHHLYTVDSTGAKRSIYKPVQEKRRQNRRNNRSSKSTSLSLDADSSSNDTLPYKQTDTDTASPSSRPRSSRAKKAIKEEEPVDDDNEMEQEEGVDEEAQEGGDARDELPITHDDQNNSEDDRKLQDRKRATFSAREEKQYQWMLEKAIKESRRTSHQGDDDDDDDDDNINDERIGEYEHQYQHAETHPEATRSDTSALITENNQNNTGVEPIVHLNERASELTQNVIPKSVSSPIPSSNITSNAMRIHTAADSIAPTFPDKQNSLSASHSSNSTSEDDTKNRAPARRSQRVSKASKRSTNNNANNRSRNAVSNGKLDIGINKPMKPRLPPQRTSLNEMRRRVSAILEFISRTQWELSGDHSSRDDLVRFVENQKFIEQVDSIFEKYDDSFKLMDDLTRSLLLWEKKYSNGSNVHETE